MKHNFVYRCNSCIFFNDFFCFCCCCEHMEYMLQTVTNFAKIYLCLHIYITQTQNYIDSNKKKKKEQQKNQLSLIRLYLCRQMNISFATAIRVKLQRRVICDVFCSSFYKYIVNKQQTHYRLLFLFLFFLKSYCIFVRNSNLKIMTC